LSEVCGASTQILVGMTEHCVPRSKLTKAQAKPVDTNSGAWRSILEKYNLAQKVRNRVKSGLSS
jgi:hypothetical protein